MKNVTIKIDGSDYIMKKLELKTILQAADLKCMEFFQEFRRNKDAAAMDVMNDYIIMIEDILADIEAGE